MKKNEADDNILDMLFYSINVSTKIIRCKKLIQKNYPLQIDQFLLNNMFVSLIWIKLDIILIYSSKNGTMTTHVRMHQLNGKIINFDWIRLS